MGISASMVKELRTRTGAGMMECKKALSESDGDMDAAMEALRKKGAAKADKKSDRVAAEGAVVSAVNDDRSIGVLVEINCETDFVAKDDNFQAYCNAVAQTVLAEQPEDVAATGDLALAGGNGTIEEARVDLINKVGEKVTIRRFEVLGAEDSGQVSAYTHGSRIGVLVSVTGGRADLGKDLAMHIAASHPLFLSGDDVPQEVLDKEKAFFASQAEDSGKPAEIVEKMVQGRLQKYLGEISLLGQPFVKDPDQTVEKLLKAENADVSAFRRLEVGEGLEKRDDDFVAEVMAQAKGE